MKKLFLGIWVCFMALMYSCTNPSDNLTISEENISEITLPEESEMYGRAVAEEIRIIVTNLNKKGYNFSEIENKKEVEEFYKEVYSASSNPGLESTEPTPLNIDPVAIQSTQQELTVTQSKVISQIMDAYEELKSGHEFKQRLISISNNVYKTVPKIEQERVFNIISVVYYGMAEIQLLEDKGEIVRRNQNNLSNNNIQGVQSFSDDGYTDSLRNCRRQRSAFGVVIGYVNSFGEQAVKVTRVAGATLGAYLILWCKVDEQADLIGHCAEVYSRCINSRNPEWLKENTYGKSKCETCRNDCVRQGGWPCGFNFYD
ncbi:hypothetical protein HMPREF0765_3832 [Sphingobacterium spiritivorum ATCC 33300]|uniref:Uncharacterized protein n=1 Tax=Sphingobacterium spiritivorum ATCC 33300 TaxID=525372 RepID=C2G2M6_SPHSI|nr:hypothetical protein [Sphingobacterium spiritivorum]EEI90516.1 hypothetical protein HMPREF0765_3832 [Sphingobacterium spiritivorum ATCC 33300]QQS95439.1 hypothetical protein I6J03_19000 [Sphingobacterium spiritivorum]